MQFRLLTNIAVSITILVEDLICNSPYLLLSLNLSSLSTFLSSYYNQACQGHVIVSARPNYFHNSNK